MNGDREEKEDSRPPSVFVLMPFSTRAEGRKKRPAGPAQKGRGG